MTIRNGPSAAGCKRLSTENRAKKKKTSAQLQPNFGTWFRATEPRRICYEIRDDANQLHDLAYLCSYLHDAKLCPSTVKRRRGCLRIRLERDCWELFELYQELVSVPSVLEISSVVELQWKFQQAVLRGLLAGPPGELYICDFFIEDGANPDPTVGPILHIRGAIKFWSLSVQLAPRPWKIAFRDTKSPVAPATLRGPPKS